MSQFVLDCSITMSWFFHDEINEYSELVMDKLQTGGAIVPQIWTYEVINTLIVGERKKRIQNSQSFWILERLQQLPICVDNGKPDKIMPEILVLSSKYNLSAYDAAYLELAVRLSLPVATRDRVLAKSVIDSGLKLLQ